MLAEKKKTNKWLAEQVGKDPATISKWCTNRHNPVWKCYFKLLKYLMWRLRTCSENLMNEIPTY